eukprot:22454_1
MVQFVLLSLFKLINLSHAVSCNSVSLMQDIDDTIDSNPIDVYPTNVCIARTDDRTHEASSIKFVCDSSGVARIQLFEGNWYCSGTPMTQDHYMGLPLTSTPFCRSCKNSWNAVCDSTPCEYALMEEWVGVISCNNDTAEEYNVYQSKTIMVGTKVECQGLGVTSQGNTCLNGTLNFVFYDDGNCSGEPNIVAPWSNYCGYGSAERYTCNLVAPDEVTNTQTPEPTTTESSTTRVTRPTTSELPSRGYALQVPNSLTFFVFLIILCSVCIVSCF